jgi:hypothetical protein
MRLYTMVGDHSPLALRIDSIAKSCASIPLMLLLADMRRRIFCAQNRARR